MITTVLFELKQPGQMLGLRFDQGKVRLEVSELLVTRKREWHHAVIRLNLDQVEQLATALDQMLMLSGRSRFGSGE